MNCRKCNGELTKDEKRNCFYCPVCNPLRVEVPPEEKKEDNLVDVKMNRPEIVKLIRDMVPELVQEELMNWHVQKPSVTASEAETIVEEVRADELAIKKVHDVPMLKPDWRAVAKALGINLFHKKKADVLAEIAEKTKGD